LSALFRKPTIEQLADLLDHSQSNDHSLVVPLSIGGSQEPIFCIHPAGGTVFCYRELASYFAGQRSVYGVQARGLDGRQSPHVTLREMASDYADAITAEVPSGPIHLVGWSLGGNIAYEVARQLRGIGRRVGMLALLDSGMLTTDDEVSEEDFLPLIAALFPGQQHESLENLRQKTPNEQLAYFIDQAAKAGIVPDDDSMVGPHVFDVFQANIKAVHNYQTNEYAGPVLLIRPGDQMRTSALFDDQSLGWSKMVGSVEIATVSGDHAHMLQRPAVKEIAEHLSRYLTEINADRKGLGIYSALPNPTIEPDVSCLMDPNASNLPLNNQT
jgi:thioesterase domain-containing protein